MEPLIPTVEEYKNPIGIAECLVNRDKAHGVKLGVAFVDDATSISRDLADEVFVKCIPFKTQLQPDWGGIYKRGHGHGGLIRGKPLQSSPGGTVTFCSVYPITAKHNLRSVTVTDSSRPGFYKPLLASLVLPNSDEVAVSWSDDFLGWQPTKADYFSLREGDKDVRNAITLFGFDMDVGRVIEQVGNPVCAVDLTFERVRKDLKLEKGQKVGMAVCFADEAKPRNATIFRPDVPFRPLPESTIRELYGQPDDVNIYTGEITFVGPKHIEYNINSFTGCSGAIVFLLDKEQPASVEEADWGKAVAVHAGAHPSLKDRNYGFLINEHPVFKEL